MVRIIPVEHLAKVKKAVPVIENGVKVNFSFGKDRVTIKGSEMNEFLVEKIVQAVDFGFDVEDALLLTDDKFVLEFINIKEHTRRKNLKEVRARVIGTSGKAKKTIENLTGSVITIQSNMVGLIVDADHLDATVQAIESLIQGAKHGNIFAYLEKQNISRKGFDEEDLGLKEGVEGAANV
jgi:KH domain-containing protein